MTDLGLLLVDHVAAGFGVLLLDESVAQRPDAAADAVSRFDDGDLGAAGQQIARGGEAGESRAGDENRHAAQRPIVRHREDLSSLSGRASRASRL